MSMFDRAFGKSASPGEVPQAPPRQPSMQERAIETLMKQFLPGFDMQQLENIGNEVQSMAIFFKTAVERIEAKQDRILLLLEQRQDDGK